MSNIFAEQDRERAERFERWGLADLPESDRFIVEMQALRIISMRKIDNDEEKQKIYSDVKEQYKAYQASKHSEIVEPKIEPISTLEDPETAYRRGYERCLQYHKEEEMKSDTPFRKGWRAASEELRLKHIAEIETTTEETDAQLNALLENNAITQLREEMKRLDERLKALERYTKE